MTRAKGNRDKLLTVDGLTVEYWARRGKIRAVDNASFTLEKGETLGLVGESGSGKSTLGLSLIRLVPYPGRIIRGDIFLDGENVLKLKAEKMRDVRGRRISYVFQDPMTSLNPIEKIRTHFVELIQTHEPKTNKAAALERAEKLLKDVGMQPERINDYPHQLSGGEGHRIAIPRAAATDREFIVAEPVSMLDVSVRAGVPNLMQELARARLSSTPVSEKLSFNLHSLNGVHDEEQAAK